VDAVQGSPGKVMITWIASENLDNPYKNITKVTILYHDNTE
jgi:hypothetical protein